MARSTPPAPPDNLVARKDHEMITEIREYQLITPLFGGGVEPNTPDPVTTIRATEIRGHLRFWWRATRGGQFKTIKELKEAEDIIWGAASKVGYERPSLVGIEITYTLIRGLYGSKLPKKKLGYKAQVICKYAS
jgi:CRISPR-associated protein Cmr1